MERALTSHCWFQTQCLGVGVFALQTLVSFCIRFNTLFIHRVGLWFDVSFSWWTFLFQTQLFYRWFRTLRWLLLKTLENLLSFFKADTFRAKVVSKKGSAVVLCRVVMTSLWRVVIILATTLVHWSLPLALQTPRWCLCSFGTPRAAVALGRGWGGEEEGGGVKTWLSAVSRTTC